MNRWSQTSADKLATCHPDLQVLANTVLQIHDCTVVWGHRNEQQQQEMFERGVSKKVWPNSKHNTLPSVAIDLVPYIVNVHPYSFKHVLHFAGIVLGVAEMLHAHGDMSMRVRWGGNWTTVRNRDWAKNSFFDGAHFELI